MPFWGEYNRFSKELLNNPELLKKAKSEVESKLIGLKDFLEGIWVLQSQLSSLKFFYEAFMNRGKGVGAGKTNKINSSKELLRRKAEPGPFHNFPESFNKTIFEKGRKTINKNFFKDIKKGLSKDGAIYKYRVVFNGKEGTYEIATRFSNNSKTEVIVHRFFRPD